MIRAVLAILGGLVVHLCLGSIFVFGNLSPYTISYLRNRTGEHTLRNVDNLWIVNVGSVVSPFGMLFGGVLERQFGVRISTFIGCALFNIGWALTYFTVQISLSLVTLTYGIVMLFGYYTAYGPPVQNASKWFPKRPALAFGAISCGIGGGAVVFNQVITGYVNPNNLTPDLETPEGDRFFTDKEVLDRVPVLFLILAGIFAVCQCIGIMALSEPPYDEIQTVNLVQGSIPADVRSKVPVKEVLWNLFSSKNGNLVLGYAMCIEAGMIFVITLYKAYGQTFISDDHFLATIGSVSAIFNSLFRPIWGLVMDRFGFQITAKFASVCFTCLYCTLIVTHGLGKEAFMIWICGLYASYCCIRVACPAALGKLFGNENMIISIGPFVGALSVASITGGFVGLTLGNMIGWGGLFLCSGFLGALAFFLTFFFDGKDKDGQEI